MSDYAILMSPSRALGGGIERYIETLEAAFSHQGVECSRIDLSRPGVSAHRQMLGNVLAEVRAQGKACRLIAAHPRLLPIAMLAAREAQVNGISVLCYGADVWGSRFGVRWAMEKALMRRTDVRVVAISSFTAGALVHNVPAIILPASVTHEWFDMLVAAGARSNVRSGVNLVTVFRLANWRDKGLPELLEAVASLGRSDIRLTVLGVGGASPELRRLLSRYERCTVRCGLTDIELADELAAADLLVLATRTRAGKRANGEGFGLVLLEAQLAGTPVVAPAHGGGYDAFVSGVTGLAPADESAPALARVLNELLSDPFRLAQMGLRASQWAQEAFAPERYAALAVARLL